MALDLRIRELQAEALNLWVSNENGDRVEKILIELEKIWNGDEARQHFYKMFRQLKHHALISQLLDDSNG